MGATANGIKSGWRCCDRCNGFYLDGSAGACVGGSNPHTTAISGGGGVTEGTVPGWQSNWRLCKKCGSLFYYGSPTNGVCFKGGAHDYENTKGYSLEMRTTKAATGFPTVLHHVAMVPQLRKLFLRRRLKNGQLPEWWVARRIEEQLLFDPLLLLTARSKGQHSKTASCRS